MGSAITAGNLVKGRGTPEMAKDEDDDLIYDPGAVPIVTTLTATALRQTLLSGKLKFDHPKMVRKLLGALGLALLR